MRTPLVTMFHETLAYCFDSTLENMLGPAVRDSVYDILGRKGINKSDLPTRFDDVVKGLLEVFGPSARVIIHRTVAELHNEYSQRVDFSYQDSLKERLDLLRERVLTDLLRPRRLQTDASFFDSQYTIRSR